MEKGRSPPPSYKDALLDKGDAVRAIATEVIKSLVAPTVEKFIGSHLDELKRLRAELSKELPDINALKRLREEIDAALATVKPLPAEQASALKKLREVEDRIREMVDKKCDKRPTRDDLKALVDMAFKSKLKRTDAEMATLVEAAYDTKLKRTDAEMATLVEGAYDTKLKRTDAEMEALLETFFQKKHAERVANFVKSQSGADGGKPPKDVKPEEVFYDQTSGFPPKVQAAMDKIDGVIGQPHLKEHFMKLCYQTVKQKHLKKLSPDTEYGTSSYHMVFNGNPGTGKTLIAGLVGKLLVALELIPSSYFHVVQLHEIKAKYLGQTPHLMAETFKRPGVYFIDEAYSIKTRDDDSFGGEILSGLCEIAENRRDGVVIILAGYKKEMEALLEQNPGLVSRFHWIFDFADYSPDDLAKIGSYTATQMKHKFSDDALVEFHKDLADGGLNAREVRNYVEEVEFCQCVRTGKMKEYSLEVLLTFTVEDVITARQHRMTCKKTKTTENETRTNKQQPPSFIMKTTHGDLRVQLDTGYDGGKK